MRSTKAFRLSPLESFSDLSKDGSSDFDATDPRIAPSQLTRQIDVPHQHYAAHHYFDVAQARANQNRRRSPRIDVTGANCKVFVSFPELNGFRFEVVTLGYLGARFLTLGKPVASLMGYDLQARLHLGPFNVDLRARLVTTDLQGAALEFVDPPEQSRDLIRDLFNLELMAATLAPFHNYSSSQAGSVQTTIYSDESGNAFEIVVSSLGLEAIRGKLGTLEVKFAWSRAQPKELRISTLSGEQQPGLQFKDRLISAIKNLQGLPAQLKYEAELGLSTAR